MDIETVDVLHRFGLFFALNDGSSRTFASLSRRLFLHVRDDVLDGVNEYSEESGFPFEDAERMSTTRQLSIVFPSYNEARRLPGTLEEVTRFCEREFDQWEIIVVDDGSSDNTAEVVEIHPEVRFIANEINRGKGESVKRGMLAARLPNVLFSDVDLSTPIAEAIPLLEAIERGADIAIASRTKSHEDKVVRRTPFRDLQAAVFRLLVRTVALKGIEDTQCGFKMFRREVVHEIFPRQRLGGWAFDVELLFLAQQRGYHIEEVPVEWKESDETRLRFWTPLQMARDILRVRFLHRRDRRELRARAREDAERRTTAVAAHDGKG